MNGFLLKAAHFLGLINLTNQQVQSYVKNAWAERIKFRLLNEALEYEVEDHFDKPWTDDLERVIRQIVIDFLSQNGLSPYTPVAITLDHGIFKAIEIL